MKSIQWKLFFPIVGIVLLAIVFLTWRMTALSRTKTEDDFGSFSKVLVDQVYNQIEQFDLASVHLREQMLSETRQSQRELLDLVFGILEDAYARQVAGILTPDQARDIARETIRLLRYDDGNYFWIDDDEYVSVLIPTTPELEGSYRGNLEDTSGQMLVRLFVEGAKDAENFDLTYFFPLPGGTDPVPKVGTSRRFDPWGWTVGTGTYVDDIDSAVAEWEEDQIADLNELLFRETFLGSYPFIIDEDGMMIAHINPDLVGKASDAKDPKTGESLDALLFATRNGVVDYWFTKPGEDPDKAFLKKGYVRTYEPRGWLIAYSTYEVDLNAAVVKTRRTMILIGFIAALAVSGITLLALSFLVKSLKMTNGRLREIAEGDADLTQSIIVNTRDEVGQLAESFNTFTSSLREIVIHVQGSSKEGREVAEVLASNVEEISAALDQILATIASIDQQSATLTNLTESTNGAMAAIVEALEAVNAQADEESSAVEESSAAVEQMVASIKSISKMATERSHMSELLSEMARKGEEQMDTTLSDIGEISASADSIKDVVTVIDGISSRINLLAMNAAIEAAHAGDAGRGFAVVADEIRKLAESTGTNAKRISESVGEIVEKIGSTTEQSRQTGDSIREIVSGSADVSTTLKEILNALEEVGRGTDQITIALGHLNQASQAVRESAVKIESQSEDGRTALAQVSDLSRQNHGGIEEIRLSLDEISTSLRAIVGLSTKNNRAMDSLEAEMGRFTV